MNVLKRTQANLNAYPSNNGFVSACMNTPVPPGPISVPVVEDIDSLCLRSVADGDQRAFASLVERWQSHLINFFYRSTGNRDDAEDLAQETFLDLYRAARRYEARSSFKAFLFTLARRRLIDGYRKKPAAHSSTLTRPRILYKSMPITRITAPRSKKRFIGHSLTCPQISARPFCCSNNRASLMKKLPKLSAAVLVRLKAGFIAPAPISAKLLPNFTNKQLLS